MPGITELTRMPWPPHSLAMTLVSPSSASFEARYNAIDGPPICVATDEMLTMAPAFDPFRWGSAAWASNIGPRTLTANV